MEDDSFFWLNDELYSFPEKYIPLNKYNNLAPSFPPPFLPKTFNVMVFKKFPLEQEKLDSTFFHTLLQCFKIVFCGIARWSDKCLSYALLSVIIIVIIILITTITLYMLWHTTAINMFFREKCIKTELVLNVK